VPRLSQKPRNCSHFFLRIMIVTYMPADSKGFLHAEVRKKLID
jgi:hypothetical protein